MAESALPDSNTPFGERVRRRLREEQVIWIITVAGDGIPQLASNARSLIAGSPKGLAQHGRSPTRYR